MSDEVRSETSKPYMKRNAATGFWPVRTLQQKYRSRRPAAPDHIRSLDGDGEPLHYCAVCFQDWPCAGVAK